VTKAFWALLEGAEIADFARLWRYRDHCKRVYVHTVADNAVHHPIPGEVCWPLVMLLSCHSHKYIFVNNQRPKVKDVNERVIDVCNKILQKLEDPSPVDQIPWYKRSKANKGSKLWMAKKPVAPDAKNNCAVEDIKKKLMARSKKVLSRKESFSNTLPYVRYALKLLKTESFKKFAIQTDKDGGWCIMDKDVYKRMVLDKMVPNIYEEIFYYNKDTSIKNPDEGSGTFGRRFR